MEVRGIKVALGKPQHIKIGKVYEVTEENGRNIISTGQGEDVNAKPVKAAAKKAPAKKKK